MRIDRTLFKQMSTKSNENAARYGVAAAWEMSLLTWERLLADAGLQLAYFSGAAHMSERRNGGAGVILKFEHVRPSRSGAFQPLRSQEVTPKFLDSAIGALKRWQFDFLSLDDAASRAQNPASARRFVCLTFDGGYRDFMTFAYPVLSRHRVPFAVYVPTAFVDGIGQAWWLALERIVAGNPRIGLMIDGVENYFATTTVEEKYHVFGLLHRWLRGLPPADLAVAIGDLCARYGVAMADVSRDIAVTWDDLAKLSRDPHAIIGSSTVNYPNLAAAKGTIVAREMAMGKTVLESAIGSTCRHFAYPFGDKDSFGPRDVLLAEEAGFLTAVSAGPGVVHADGKSNLLALPRIAWDGRRKSVRALRAVLSGITLRREQEAAPEPEANYG